MATALKLMVYRHSAFYSPLLAGIGAGFFARAGFAPTYTVMPADRSVGAMLASGEIHVSQAAVSSAWPYLDRGEAPPFVIFANLNRRDGFLIAARRPDPAFRWDKLATGRFMFAHGGQPQAMLSYALHLQGVDLGRISGIDAGGPDAAMAAFAAGEGDYFHEQAPYPQQLEADGHAHIVASVGEVIGPVAFSSLAATPAWLMRPEAKTFLRAYRAARAWTHTALASEVAAAVQSYFPDIRAAALANAIAYYQKLGCWGGGLPIERSEYETALDVFAHSGLVAQRHDYEKVVVPPPL
jgi:NitT/TauT family transport system substrate-binding protein